MTIGGEAVHNGIVARNVSWGEGRASSVLDTMVASFAGGEDQRNEKKQCVHRSELIPANEPGSKISASSQNQSYLTIGAPIENRLYFHSRYTVVTDVFGGFPSIGCIWTIPIIGKGRGFARAARECSRPVLDLRR